MQNRESEQEEETVGGFPFKEALLSQVRKDQKKVNVTEELKVGEEHFSISIDDDMPIVNFS